MFDFTTNFPSPKEPNGYPESYVWIDGTTRPLSFPNGEVVDGCRKAPIMTIGINRAVDIIAAKEERDAAKAAAKEAKETAKAKPKKKKAAKKK